MQWTIILEATTGWGERTCTPVYTLSRPMLDLKPEQVGLTLVEAKTLLARLQAQLVCPRSSRGGELTLRQLQSKLAKFREALGRGRNESVDDGRICL